MNPSPNTLIVRGSGSVQAAKNAQGGEAVRAAMRNEDRAEITVEWLDAWIAAEWVKAGPVEVGW